MKRKICCSALQSAIDADMCIINGDEICWFGEKKLIKHAKKCPFCEWTPDGLIEI